MLAMNFGADGAVVMSGRLDAAQCPAALAFLEKVNGTVTLDCRGLEYISSAGLGVLLKTQKRLTGAGGKLRLTGVNRHLQDIFLYSGFDQIFEIEPAR
jgi:anti-sigma B factor antagonist